MSVVTDVNRHIAAGFKRKGTEKRGQKRGQIYFLEIINQSPFCSDFGGLGSWQRGHRDPVAAMLSGLLHSVINQFCVIAIALGIGCSRPEVGNAIDGQGHRGACHYFFRHPHF